SDSDSDEIVTISRLIRRALECPICLTLMSVISCYCPNGHAVCESCMLTLLNMSSSQERPCPLCRALMVQSLITSATVDKLTELSRQVKVKCSNWFHGCTRLVPVRYMNKHESRCLYVPSVPCRVTVCQWLGIYEQLYEHVSSSHPGVAVQTSTNQLNVTDVQDITTNRRRTYLVQSTYGMIWVMLSRVARSRIQTALFLVNDHWDGHMPNKNHGEPTPTDIVYRVTWFDANDRSRTKSRTKRVHWSTSLKPEFQLLLSNSYTTFRFKTGRMEINWFQCPMYKRSHSSTTR
ncbi:E3 ubiquitin-protein ligase SINA-like 10, partial [Rhopalosiphum maidis]|uniref:E3 ubiquitin-protein ligase SINA-like 10 n=1 Tax=Rhopalosiphum maidis TaxID=43146 RepID=UPI000EFDB90B